MCSVRLKKRLVEFSTPKTDMAKKDDDDAVAAALLISVVVNRKKRNRKVIKMYLHKFCTIYKQAKLK